MEQFHESFSTIGLTSPQNERAWRERSVNVFILQFKPRAQSSCSLVGGTFANNVSTNLRWGRFTSPLTPRVVKGEVRKKEEEEGVSPDGTSIPSNLSLSLFESPIPFSLLGCRPSILGMSKKSHRSQGGPY